MPQYLAPGVYIEEVSFRSKSIEGASTTTTGFIGPTRYGPIDLDNELITSLGDFKRIYGDGEQLEFGTSFLHNYTWHAARGFFAEGGRQLYISRCFRRIDTETSEGQDLAIVDTNPTQVGTLWADGLGVLEVWEGLALDPDHSTSGAPDALTYVFGSHVEEPHTFPERAHGRD